MLIALKIYKLIVYLKNDTLFECEKEKEGMRKRTTKGRTNFSAMQPGIHGPFLHLRSS